MGRTIAQQTAVLALVVRGPHPIAAETAGALDLHAALAMDGHTGSTRWGSSASPFAGIGFRGDLGPLQNFKGAAGFAARPGGIRSGIQTGAGATGLPSTRGPGAPFTQDESGGGGIGVQGSIGRAGL